MATIWIWNAIASRRRSASDTFVENGLGVLAAGVERDGHAVRVIDWARGDFYSRIAPSALARLIRHMTLALMALGRKRKGFMFKALGLATLWLQQGMALVQRRRMARALRNLAREVARHNLQVFGMKVWYGEAFAWAKYLAHEIRRRSPETLLVAGGYHATLYEEDFLKHSPFDLAVIGEGETALSRILDLVDEVGANGREAVLTRLQTMIASGTLTNVVWRDGAAIRKTAKHAGNIDERRVPVYGDMSGKVRLHVLLESSGCAWGKCSFCVHQHLEPDYVKRKVDRIVDEIRTMRGQGIGLFRFAGSDTPPDFGAAIAQGILNEGLRIEYAMGSRARPNARDPEVFQDLADKYALMIRSGLRAVFMGGETGHDRINEQVMNKGLNRSDLIWTIRALREAEKREGRHVDISLALIYPTPLIEGVTDDEVMAANLELLRAAQPDAVMVTPPGPFKNSDWFRNRTDYGFEFEDAVIGQAMEYEYVLYKPPELWPDLNYALGGRGFKALLRLCGRMRAAVEDLGIPTDLSDEHFLMLRACGYEGADGAKVFKNETLADIVSCDYRRIARLSELTNAASMALARQSAWRRDIETAASAVAPIPLCGAWSLKAV